MEILDIVKYPNAILRQKSSDVTDPTAPEIKELILNMVATMNDADGIGLAAPQIGIHKNIVIIGTEDGPLPLINPKIKKSSWKKSVAEEGCLSIPNVFGLVKRPDEISVEATTHEGKTINFKAQDMFARVIQHEVDHLNGILFTDIASKITKGDFDKSIDITE